MRGLFARLLLCAFVLLIGSFGVAAQNTPAAGSTPAAIEISDTFTQRKIGLHLTLLEDPSTQLSMEQVRQPELAAQFTAASTDSPSFGYTSSAYWARFTITSTTPLFLTLAYAQTDLAQLWCADANGHTVVNQRAGDHVPRAEWPSSYREPTFTLPPTAQTCWLRVQSSASMQLPLTLYSQDAFVSMRLTDNALQALYFGALLVMLVYNGLIAVSTRSLAYTSYSAFLLSYAVFQCAFGGLGYALLWRDAIGFADAITPLSLALTGMSSTFFGMNLLNLQRSAPRWFQFGWLIVGLCAIILVLSVVSNYSFAIICFFIFTLPWAVFLIGSGIYQSWRDLRVAKIYLAAWLVFIAGTLIIIASRLGWLPVNGFTANATQIGSAIEFILLSFALADRIKTSQAALLQAQKEITDTLRISEQELDAKVQQRTAELEATTTELQHANQRITQALQEAEHAREAALLSQNQLIEAEKMASLGLLVSNVAHEINSPISAVQSSNALAVESFDAILQALPRLLQTLPDHEQALFLQLMGSLRQKPTSLSAREERQHHKQLSAQLEQAGVEDAHRKARLLIRLHAHQQASTYLPLLLSPHCDRIFEVAHHVADVLTGTQNVDIGAAKVGRIVASLKALSGNDRTTAMFESHVYQSMEKAIATLEPMLQHVDVVRIYQEAAPLRCDLEALQQVWMHVIQNALHASQHHGVIMIGIRPQDTYLAVRIADFGCGMAPELTHRIFEPFFTTRTAGEGGGMGLAIAKKIIEQHHGRIEVQSEVGVGTTFTVLLPYTH
jgi:signal transduction histidine kinase